MSLKEDDVDNKMSQIFETLNINNLPSKTLHISSIDLKNSLASLGDRVIVGKFSDKRGDQVISSSNQDTGIDSTKNEDEDESITGNKEATIKQHDEKIFNLSCACVECSKYRETIIQLYLEDLEYNQLWERLQDHLLKFYDIIPQSPDSPVFQKYRELMNKQHAKWLSDGSIDLKNNMRLSFGPFLPLSNESIFQTLYNRDPHQLFELICIQMQAVVLAYTEGLNEIMKYNAKEVLEYNPSDLLNYIFDGYAKICHSEKTISALFFELEAGHLLQFHLTLSQVYKRLYQRWIYLELQKLVPECILKLKELDYDDNYTNLVQKFIKFDDAMTTITQTWRDIWLLIHNYHKSKEDIARRKRIMSIHAIFLAIQESDFDFDENFSMVEKSLVEWISLENRNEAWQYAVQNIKQNWNNCTNPRVSAKILNLECTKCKSTFVPHFVTCNCRTCIIAGGPCYNKIKDTTKNSLCAKCTFFDKFLNGITTKRYIEAMEGSETKDTEKHQQKIYHLGWAVFKHLDGRLNYASATLDPVVFCVFQEIPCTHYACRVAVNIITLTYPLNFSKYLVKNYRPLDEATRKSIMTIQDLDVNTIKNLDTCVEDVFSANKKLHPLHVTDKAWLNENERLNDEEHMKKASALAEGFLSDFPMPQRNTIFTYFFKLFRVNGKDIVFVIDQLDQIKKSNSTSTKFMASLESAVKSRDDQLEDISARMNNLKIISKTIKREKHESMHMDNSANVSEDSSKSVGKNKSSLIDGEIKKPLVEALQLAASNKKLEAELRSLQKEHSMLKDMVRDLEHIHEEKHQCNHSADESSDSRESKSSHRTEGQCICYYCTIFGQNDCSHNSRVNETRDRLRKRLRKMQNNKEYKPSTLKDIKIAQKDFKMHASITKNVKQCENSKNRRILYQQTTQVASKVQLQPKQTSVIKPQPIEEKLDVQKVTPINCAPVDDILKFIEGDAEKKEKEAAAAKKAAKKKQKLRKFEQKKISELEELKAQYEDLSAEESEIKKTLKVLKKRKNKNRLVEAEETLRNISEKRSTIVAAVNDTIRAIRKLNSNFEFDFGVDLVEDLPTTQIPQPIEVNHHIPGEQHRNCEISVDPSKRMVTIRRINLPHSEPQVTVTAKGSSPDKDQLLYTFINGQLVPASPENQQLIQQMKSQSAQYMQNYISPVHSANNSSEPMPKERVLKPVTAKKKLIETQKVQPQLLKHQLPKANNNNNKRSESVKSNENTRVLQTTLKKEETKISHETDMKSKKKDKITDKQEKKVSEDALKKNGNKKQSKKLEKQQQVAEKKGDMKTEDETSKKVKKRVSSYIDPEFDNNAFKLLNLDDSETDDDSVSTNKSSNKNLEKTKNNPVPKPEVPATKQQKKTVSKSTENDLKSKTSERKQSAESISSRKNSKQEVSKPPGNATNESKNSKSNVKLTQKSNIQQLVTTSKSNKEVKQKKTKPVENCHDHVQTLTTTKKSTSVSLMEQLSRGVKVEGLTLPPGITLTRVDSSTCENLKAKKESINKIVQPMQPAVQHTPSSFSDQNVMMMNQMYGMPQQDNVIMVDTPVLNGAKSDANRSKNKRNRKKKKTGDENFVAPNQQKDERFKACNTNGHFNNNKKNPMMVTLRNPMFNSVTDTIKKQPLVTNRPPLSYDQPAAIIENGNGMYTIRNPALHQALSQGQPNNLPHYNSYNMSNPSNVNGPSMTDTPYSGDSLVNGGRKCKSVIGSEIKTAHQIKQAQKEQQMVGNWSIPSSDTSNIYGLPFSAMPGMNKSYSPFEPAYNSVGFNSDFVSTTDYSQSYFNDTYANRDSNCGVFTTNRNNFSPPVNHNYFENGSSVNSKYDDASFLQSLQPGQRLNSEVTIHNINEAKFLRDQQQESNGVEITRIPVQGSLGELSKEAFVQGNERISINELLKNPSLLYSKRFDLSTENTNVGDYGDDLFNSESVDSHENDSCFQRCNNQYYDSITQQKSKTLNRAPGSGKPNSTKASDSPSSSVFGEIPSSLSLSSSNTPPSTEDGFLDFAPNTDSIFYDNNTHNIGIIGSEMKAVQGNID